eukprot:gene14203-20173_t
MALSALKSTQKMATIRGGPGPKPFTGVARPSRTIMRANMPDMNDPKTKEAYEQAMKDPNVVQCMKDMLDKQQMAEMQIHMCFVQRMDMQAQMQNPEVQQQMAQMQIRMRVCATHEGHAGTVAKPEVQQQMAQMEIFIRFVQRMKDMQAQMQNPEVQQQMAQMQQFLGNEQVKARLQEMRTDPEFQEMFEDLAKNGMGLTTHGGHFVSSWVEHIPMQAIAGLLRAAANFNWSQELYCNLIKISSQLLAATEEHGPCNEALAAVRLTCTLTALHVDLFSSAIQTGLRCPRPGMDKRLAEAATLSLDTIHEVSPMRDSMTRGTTSGPAAAAAAMAAGQQLQQRHCLKAPSSSTCKMAAWWVGLSTASEEAADLGLRPAQSDSRPAKSLAG